MVAEQNNTIAEEKNMHTADLKEDKAMGKRVGVTVTRWGHGTGPVCRHDWFDHCLQPD